MAAGRPVTPTHQEPMEHDVDYSPDNIQFLTTYGSGNQQVYPNPVSNSFFLFSYVMFPPVYK